MDKPKTMRDALIGKISQIMQTRKDIFFLAGDLGAPALDELRANFKDRFINVGIAEQNLVNVSAGLALEGFTSYAYSIVPFLTMRAFEQIKNNLSLMAQFREVNVNLIGLGAGISYDVSGSSHHGIEDISIIKALPNMVVFSPSDAILAEKFAEWSIKVKKPKYARLDSKLLPIIYHDATKIDFDKGFCELASGEKICIVSTGFMTHRALEVANECLRQGLKIGVIDVFMLKPLNCELLWTTLSKYSHIITLEEGFINKGGLDGSVAELLRTKKSTLQLTNLGFGDSFVSEVGDRNYLHKLHHLDAENIVKIIKNVGVSNSIK